MGFALSFLNIGQCESLNAWNDNSRVPRFFVPYSDVFEVVFEVKFVAFFRKFRRICVVIGVAVKW